MMRELLRANVLANLAYFRRSRLLLAFALIFILLTGLSSLPTFFWQLRHPKLQLVAGNLFHHERISAHLCRGPRAFCGFIPPP
jgi:hypothetical protein